MGEKKKKRGATLCDDTLQWILEKVVSNSTYYYRPLFASIIISVNSFNVSFLTMLIMSMYRCICNLQTSYCTDLIAAACWCRHTSRMWVSGHTSGAKLTAALPCHLDTDYVTSLSLFAMKAVAYGSSTTTADQKVLTFDFVSTSRHIFTRTIEYRVILVAWKIVFRSEPMAERRFW